MIIDGVEQGQLQEWMEHSILIFENLKPFIELIHTLNKRVWIDFKTSLTAHTVYFKTKMSVAGVVFEPHPPNFEDLYNF